MRQARWGWLLVVLLMLVSLVSWPATAARPYEGVTLTVITQSPPYIAKPVEMFAPEFERLTGAKINLVTTPFADLYTKIMASFTLGVETYDIVIFASAWMGDFAGNQYLRDITDWVRADQQLDFQSVLPAYQQTVSWGGKIYALPLDGDLHVMYYRRDALENPAYRQQFQQKYGYPLSVPKTWREYRDIAEFFNGWDWDADGRVEYGVCEAMKRGGQAFWFYLSRAAGYVGVPAVRGALWFDPDTMEPRINNPGFVQALEDWIEIRRFGPPGILNFDSGDVRSIFAAGDCALAVDWPDTGIISATSPQSVVKGRTGTAVLPGSRRVYNAVSKAWADLAQPNVAPFLAFGGWVGAVTVSSKNPKAAYEFLAFLGNPQNSYTAVTTDATGFNPYRVRHFEDLSRWKEFGFVEPDLSGYLGAIRASLEHPNAQLDLKLPGQAQYQDTAEVYLASALAGERSAKDALDRVAAEWRRITDQLGRDRQRQLYRQFLGLTR